jgi:hypothetical protein
MDVHREVGAHVQRLTGWSVDLENADHVLRIECVNKVAFVGLERFQGPGGIPTGVTGKVVDLDAVGIRSYIAEPDRGRRDWSKQPEAQGPVYRNRRRIRGARGRRLMRQRGERIERSFAHLYDTGGMRRTHLRGHENILKRLLIHAGGFNLGLLVRSILAIRSQGGRPRQATVISSCLIQSSSDVMRRNSRRSQPNTA